MKQELVDEIMQQMLPYLNNAQMKQLKQVVEQALYHYEVTEAETKPEEDDSEDFISMFISAKRIEGCSEKTLDYYQKTIETMVPAVDNLLQQSRTLYHQLVDNSTNSMYRLSEIADINPETYSTKDNWTFVNYLDTSSITAGTIDEIQHILPSEEKLPSWTFPISTFKPLSYRYKTINGNSSHLHYICRKSSARSIKKITCTCWTFGENSVIITFTGKMLAF